jgi:hypothetical protein
MKTKVVKLRNLYSGEIVFTESFGEVRKVDNVQLVEVYKKENPQRKYFVNKESFQVVTK